jgi:hypothetical protein
LVVKTLMLTYSKYIIGIAYFDVAVLEIEEVQLSNTVRTICLPDSTDFREDKYEQVTTNIYLITLRNDFGSGPISYLGSTAFNYFKSV